MPASSEQDAAALEAFARHPPAGLSTLDLLACPPRNGGVGRREQLVPAHVHREMVQQAKAAVADSRRATQATRPRVHDMNTLGLPPDPPPLGQQPRQQPRLKCEHGTAELRRLVAGRFMRLSELEGRELTVSLVGSTSAPNLRRAGLLAAAASEQDTLDEALGAGKAPSRGQESERATSPGEQRRVALRQQENELQTELLRVSRKLSRKYTQQLYPRRTSLASPSQIQALAQRWQQQEKQQEPEAPTILTGAASERDDERYKLYMAGRFSTQMQLDFYRRELEPREPATDKHRRQTMHSKYGNALARNKRSLRGPF